MENYVLHDNLNHANSQYLIKTLNADAQKRIISSVFRDGSLIKTSSETYNGHLTEKDLVHKVHENHRKTKSVITTLFKLSNKFSKSDLIGKRVLVGKAFIKNMMYKEASREFESILKFAKNYSVIYYYLGRCYFKTNEFQKAVKYLSEATKYNKNYADYHFHLGVAFLELGKCKNAIQEFMYAINLNAYYNQAYYFLALAYIENAIAREDFSLAKDVINKAENYLMKAVQISPDYNTELFQKGLEHLKRTKLEEAYRALKENVPKEEVKPFNDLMIDFYIKYLKEDDKLDLDYIQNYINKLNDLVRIYPQYADLHYELGIAKIIMSKALIFRAIIEFEEALNINAGFKKAEKKRNLLLNEQKGINTLLLNLLEP